MQEVGKYMHHMERHRGRGMRSVRFSLNAAKRTQRPSVVRASGLLLVNLSRAHSWIGS